MTGRDLILYILANQLEDEQVVQDGKLIGFNTVDEQAVKLGVGSSTVEAMIQLGQLDYVVIGNTNYIPDISCKTMEV